MREIDVRKKREERTKAVEVAEIEKLNGRKNHRWTRRIKKKTRCPLQ